MGENWDRVWAQSPDRRGGGRGDQGRLPGGGERRHALDRGEAQGRELLRAKGRKTWVSGDQGVSAGDGEGAELLRCQLSPRMECPGGLGGRGRFLLQWLFWGLNQIKSAAAPRAPSSCAEQLSGRGG